MTLSPSDGPKPLYQRVKDYVVERIRTGDWPESRKIPSENELGQMLGVSRITINRAFRELAEEGRLQKVPGVGTFVAEQRPRFGLVTIQNIADEIQSRGHRHTCSVTLLRKEAAPDEVGHLMSLRTGEPVYHSIVIHRDDGVPIQIEERYVLPAIAPTYIEQDYTRMTTFDYLRRVAEVTEAEQVISAFMPTPGIYKDLEMPPTEPCLFIRRRTWRKETVTTLSRLTHPASRFEISGRFPIHLIPTSRLS